MREGSTNHVTESYSVQLNRHTGTEGRKGEGGRREGGRGAEGRGGEGSTKAWDCGNGHFACPDEPKPAAVSFELCTLYTHKPQPSLSLSLALSLEVLLCQLL